MREIWLKYRKHFLLLYAGTVLTFLVLSAFNQVMLAWIPKVALFVGLIYLINRQYKALNEINDIWTETNSGHMMLFICATMAAVFVTIVFLTTAANSLRNVSL